MDYMDMQETSASVSPSLQSLSEHHLDPEALEYIFPISQSTPRKNRPLRQKVRVDCCMGMLGTRDLRDTQVLVDQMSVKDKKKFLHRLIQEHSSCSKRTISYKGTTLCQECCFNLFHVTKKEWRKLEGRKKSKVSATKKMNRKQELAEAWLRNFLRCHGQYSPCASKMTYVQGYNAKKLHHQMIASFDKSIPKGTILKYSAFTLLLKKMKISFGKVRHRLMLSCVSIPSLTLIFKFHAAQCISSLWCLHEPEGETNEWG